MMRAPGVSDSLRRSVWRGRVALASLALLVGAGACNTSTTPGFPSPDFQAPLGARFPLRPGDLAVVSGLGDFLYLSVQTVGADSRCPPQTQCASPGFVDLTLELETQDAQGAIRIRVPAEGEALGTYRTFEIRVHGVDPPGSPNRILPTDYTFLLSVSQRDGA